MCGRIDVDEVELSPWVEATLKVKLPIETNHDLRPTQQVSAITQGQGDDHNRLKPIQTQWGIKPGWAKKIIINAQSETVTTKKTFKQAFLNQRCLIPCSGWYEWRDEGGARKQKYRFFHPSHEPLLMAGFWFENEPYPQLVTLTTPANATCEAIHHRMPVLIGPEQSEAWFHGHLDQLAKLMLPIDEDNIALEKS